MIESLYPAIRSLWVVWLVAVFVGIVAWVYWPSRRRKLQEHANIPLRDDQES